MVSGLTTAVRSAPRRGRRRAIARAAAAICAAGGISVVLGGATPASDAASGRAAVAAAVAPVTLTINATAGRTAVSPLIYGLNDGTSNSSFAADLSAVRPTLVRQGGNSWTPYNWENNATNGGSDWCFENYGELSRSTTPGAGALPTVQADAAAGVASLVTVPITGYVAADEKADAGGDECDQVDEATDPNNIMNTANYVATRLDVNNPTDPAPLSTTPILTDGNVYQNQFVYWLGQTAPTARVLFSLDNEPDDWRCTHPEVWPPATIVSSGGCADPYNGGVADQEGAGVGYAAFMTRELAYARAIKAVDPTAAVLGPVLGGYSGLLELQGVGSDYATLGDFVDYYLKAVHAADQAAGRTLIDAFDFHWYPQMSGVDSTDTSAAVVAAREQAPRSLWDPTYTEDSWITQCCSNGPIDLLPWLQGKIAADNPGMPLSISEWRYGAGGDISGAIADADALGIFGRYGVQDATYWPDAATSFAHGAFEIYRNYDGHGAAFGDTEVKATTSSPAMTSVYASIAAADPTHVVIVAINKNTAATPAKIVLQGSASTARAALYTLTSASATPQLASGLSASGANTFTYTMPAQSVSVIVPVPATSPVFDADAPATSEPAGRAYPTYTFNAAGSPAPTYAVASGSLPAGLTLSSAGVLSGTPTTAGTSTFTVSATNGHAPAALTPTITITVFAPVAPTFTADSPPASRAALLTYSYTFKASGVPAPTFALAGGSLPPGLALSASGVLSGEVTSPGTYGFSVVASNGALPNAVSPQLSITVGPATSGSVVAWGDGADGRLGDASTANALTAVTAAFPAGVKISQVAGGTDGGVALSSTGVVYAWGANDWGQLGDAVAVASSATPVRVAFPAGTPAVTQVAEGDGFVAVRTADGNVWEWGANWTGQIGSGDTSGASVTSPVKVGLGASAGTVTAISAGVNWVEALTSAHNLLAWGGNIAGQLGTGVASGAGVYAPVAVRLGAYAGRIAAVSANSYGYEGGGHTLALTTGGAVLAWGNNPNGELGDGTTTDSATPVLVSPPTGAAALPAIKAISAGYYHNLALTSTGRVLSWGANWSDQLGIGSGVSGSDVPVYVSPPPGSTALPVVAAVSANGNQSEILTIAGAVYSWGTSASTTGGVTTAYSLGSGTTAAENIPTLVTLPAGTTISGVAAGQYSGYAIVR